MSEKEKSMLVSEVNILRELKHPNIVRYKVSSNPRSSRVVRNFGSFCFFCCLLALSRCSLFRCLTTTEQDRIIDRESSTIYIIMEFCENGDLSSVIRK